VISIVYEVEVDDFSTLQPGDDAAEAELVYISDVIHKPDKFAFDHHKILSDYVNSKSELKSLL